MLDSYQQHGFGAYQMEWNELDLLKDSQVELMLENRSYHGIARGVDTSGALRLQTGQSIRLVKGGEVSLRPRK